MALSSLSIHFHAFRLLAVNTNAETFSLYSEDLTANTLCSGPATKISTNKLHFFVPFSFIMLFDELSAKWAQCCLVFSLTPPYKSIFECKKLDLYNGWKKFVVYSFTRNEDCDHIPWNYIHIG